MKEVIPSTAFANHNLHNQIILCHLFQVSFWPNREASWVHFLTCSQQTSTCSGSSALPSVVCEHGEGSGELGEPPSRCSDTIQTGTPRPPVCRRPARAAGKPRTAAAASRSFDLWPACLPASLTCTGAILARRRDALRLSAFGEKHWHGVELLESCKCFSEENGSFNGTFC